MKRVLRALTGCSAEHDGLLFAGLKPTHLSCSFSEIGLVQISHMLA